MTATEEMLKTSISSGIISANNRATRSEVSVRSSLAASKRSSSLRVRTNARMTRMPDRFSRKTALMVSIFV